VSAQTSVTNGEEFSSAYDLICEKYFTVLQQKVKERKINWIKKKKPIEKRAQLYNRIVYVCIMPCDLDLKHVAV
jgi:hypothetical protein